MFIAEAQTAPTGVQPLWQQFPERAASSKGSVKTLSSHNDSLGTREPRPNNKGSRLSETFQVKDS